MIQGGIYMIINHNMNAINAHRNSVMNTTNLGKTMEKLSSGLRINRAGDDAAGLSISEKMRGQIRALSQAQRNAQDGISYIQTMEGALTEVSDMLVRAKELTTQYQNGTYSSADKKAITDELQKLDDEIQNILTNTKFNGITMNESVDIQIDDGTSKVTIAAAGLSISVKDLEKPADVEALIEEVNKARSTYGALQNRLEHTSNNLGTTVENLTAAEARIRDTDMAKEMMEFTKRNILIQASQAMLAQANQTPQTVLALLR